MGRGSSSSETRVRKVRQDYSEGGQSSSSSGQKQDTSRNNCLFSFSASITIPESEVANLKKESDVVIVPHHTEADRLDLFIGNKNFGPYTGPHADRIRKCVKKHYVYDGKVESLSKTAEGIKIDYSVQGRGR